VLEGGLSDVLRENLSHRTEVISLSVPEHSSHMVGTQGYLQAAAGLTVDAIIDRLRCERIARPHEQRSR